MADSDGTGRPLKQDSLSHRIKRRTMLMLAYGVALGLTLGLAGSASSMKDQAVQVAVARAPQGPEALLVNGLLEISRNHLDTAMNEIDNAIKAYPNFRLAHLIKGDLLLAHTRPINTIGDAPNAPRQRITELREEAKARLQRRSQNRPSGDIPKYLLQMQPEQHYAIVVDVSLSTLYVFQNVNGEPRYVTDFYISSGKNGAEKLKEGDQRTPLGVYYVTADLPKSRLSDFYGVGAYPISYPNEWDRQHGRNGHGIWLHGTPSDTYSRPPHSSNGCVVLTNQDLTALGKTLQVGLTPVIITEHVEWVRPDDWRALRNDLSNQIENWRREWENRNTEAYLRYYAKSFNGNGQTLAQWANQKRRVNAAKSWIKVDISSVSMFLYPGYGNLAVVSFDQDYSSSNLSTRMKKRQYWINENNHWKIIYEGTG
ncbi:MAG TPA: L,D-transpeptidase family protein [Burkholderiales bacterium]|nr:L,D-transpeptidase family protein [Burkholderiales bacterium]